MDQEDIIPSDETVKEINGIYFNNLPFATEKEWKDVENLIYNLADKITKEEKRSLILVLSDAKKISVVDHNHPYFFSHNPF